MFGITTRSGHARRTKALRRVEQLETRIVLSAVPPTVAEVSVASSDWTPSFYSYLEANSLGTDGYALPVGSADQLDPLPWSNIDQIRVTFSEDVHIQSEDLTLSGVGQATYSASDFDYYPEDRLAVWSYGSPLPSERFLIDLDGDGIDPITGLGGEVLDGEWVDSVSTFGSGSGNGVAGGDFEFSFNVLHGDALGIDLLEYNNLYEIYNRTGQGISDPFYAAKADIDGSGLIEAADWQAVWSNLFASTPSGAPVGSFSDGPSSASIGLATITDDAVDHAFSLFNAFEDGEDADSQLTYAIESNSDSSLFDSVTIDSINGELLINTAAAKHGRAMIALSATDSSGLTTLTNFTVDVGRHNSAPSLTASTTDYGSGFWLIEGWVTDPDDDVDDLYVELSGVISTRVSVDENGYYFYVTHVEPLEGGLVYASTSDQVDTSQQVLIEIGWV